MVRKREALPRPPLKSSGGQAPDTPHLKAGHQRGLPPRRRPPSARSSCPAAHWFRHGFLGGLLLPLHRTLLCCSGGTGLHGGREGGACLVGFWSWVLRLLKRLGYGRDSCTTSFPFAKYACFPWFLSCDKVSLCCFVRSAPTRRPSLSRIWFFPSLSLIMTMASLHLWNLMITGRGLSDFLERGPKRWALSTSVSYQSFCGKCRRRVLITRAVHLSNDSPASSFIPYSSTFDRREYRSCPSTSSSSFLKREDMLFCSFPMESSCSLFRLTADCRADTLSFRSENCSCICSLFALILSSSFWKFRSSCWLWDWVVFIMSISWLSFPSRRSAWLSTLVSRHLTESSIRVGPGWGSMSPHSNSRNLRLGGGWETSGPVCCRVIVEKAETPLSSKMSVCMALHSRFAFGMRRQLSYILCFAV